jgi:hypothetical protein
MDADATAHQVYITMFGANATIDDTTHYITMFSANATIDDTTHYVLSLVYAILRLEDVLCVLYLALTTLSMFFYVLVSS